MTGSPLAELEMIINRLELTLDKAVHEVYQDSVKEARQAAVKAAHQAEIDKRKAEGKSSSFFSSFALRSSAASKRKSSVALDPIAWEQEVGSPPRSERSKRTLPPSSSTAAFCAPKYLPVEQVVEDLRRIAELVVIGENYVTAQEKKQERKLQRSKQKWKQELDSIDGVGSTTEESDDEDAEGAAPKECADLFDMFFERNVLETIVHLLSGSAFDLVDHVEHLKHLQVLKGGNDDDPENLDPETAILDVSEQDAQRVLLPPIAVATQAIQSISILIQNVSRATSLYMILSNHHINALIDLSLDRYATAEQKRRVDVGDESRAIFASPEMSELTTHFVTLLKSLAMRMNAETLQFFLKYPTEGEMGVPVSSPHYSPKASNSGPAETGQETEEALRVSFPLYQRSLEFCAAHQESFVRITAMNICLNTLRLTTIEPVAVETKPTTDEEEEGAFGSAALLATPQRLERSVSSPDGVLHTAQPLPFRERLAIARYTCIPSRVERLIAPIFTKLSERWTALDESIREMDENKGPVGDASGQFEKVAKAKEKVRRERIVRAFTDRAADLQDELMLLEDVFKVGLTVLNEQLIEMMFATFVYPMISQPLLNFYQRYTSKMESTQRMSASQQHPFGGFEGMYHDVEYALSPFSGPAKTALYTIASVFHSLSHPPLLRLLYTALFHPLSPDSTSVPTVRSNLVVSTTDVQGNATIRLDPLCDSEGLIPDDRTTYPFGTTPNNRRLSRTEGPDLAKLEDKEVCVFVLAPALAEVLEFDGHDVGLITRTRPNSYREAIFQCFDMPHEFSEVRALATCAVDAAISAFDARFAANIMLGTDLKTFSDDIPADERNLDSEQAYAADDRGLGGSAIYESRHNVTRPRGGKVGSDLTGEFVSALSKGTTFACRDRHDGWKIGYDDVAGHALLHIGKGSSRALVQSAKVLENRWRQGAAFFAETPGSMYNPMGGSSTVFPIGAPDANSEDYEDQLFGIIVNTIIFDKVGDCGKSVMEMFLKLKKTEEQKEEEGFSVPISAQSTFDDVGKRVGALLLANLSDDNEGESSDLAESRGSAFCLMKLDALLSLLKDLAASGGLAIRDVNLQGVALSTTGRFIQVMEHKMSRQVYAPISPSLSEAMMDSTKIGPLPDAGSVLPLAGKKAIPCVCEAPARFAHLFLDAGTGVQAEGVTWQSLYLVFSGDLLIFAQPLPSGPGGDGRVVASCYAERVQVGMDPEGDRNPSPARRLFLSHATFEPMTPPGLFMYDNAPKPAPEVGPFIKVQPYVSRLDVWFENQRAADLAYKILSTHIFQAKANRGRRVQAFLDPRGHYSG
eukprot:scaffold569_cov165-Amphora_coffeaeformis.AAC.12